MRGVQFDFLFVLFLVFCFMARTAVFFCLFFPSYPPKACQHNCEHTSAAHQDPVPQVMVCGGTSINYHQIRYPTVATNCMTSVQNKGLQALKAFSSACLVTCIVLPY